MSRFDADLWLDGDGYHVWVRHDCVDGPEQTMLPWPTWSADSRKCYRGGYRWGEIEWAATVPASEATDDSVTSGQL